MPTETDPNNPPPAPFTLVYACRHCGKVFDAYPILDEPGMLKAILGSLSAITPTFTTEVPGVLPKGPLPNGLPSTLPMVQQHSCAEGKWGIADCVGIVRVADAGGVAGAAHP